MKHLLRSIVLLVILGLLASCGSSTPTPVDPDTTLVTDPAVIDDALEVVDLEASAASVQTGTQVKPNVLPFGKERMDAIVAMDRANGTVTLEKNLLSAAELEKLVPGTVVVGHASKRIKRGFLRKITNVTDAGAQLVVQSIPATFKDVFSAGGFRVHRQNLINASSKVMLADGQVLPMRTGPDLNAQGLNPQNLLGLPVTINFCPVNLDGNKNTKNDQVCVTGSLDLDLGFDLTFQCEGVLCTNPYFDTHLTLTERANLTVEGKLTRSVSKTIPLGTVVLGSFAIPVAGIPVVFIAEADLTVNLNGQVSANLRCVANQKLEFSAGVEFKDGRFDPYTKFDNEINSSDVQVSIEASAKATLSAEASVLVYGIGGPTLTVDAWAKIIAGFPRNPTWEVNAGLDLLLGVEMDIFGLINLDWKEKVMGTKWDVTEAPNSKPSVIVREPVDAEELILPRQFTPTTGEFWDVNFNANTSDAEDGKNCCTLEWFVDGGLKKRTTAGSGHKTNVQMGTGQHNVRVVATDSNGATTTKNFSITVVSCGEGVSVLGGSRTCLIQGPFNPLSTPTLALR